MKNIYLVSMLFFCGCNVLPMQKQNVKLIEYNQTLEKENALLRKQNDNWNVFAKQVADKTKSIQKETDKLIMEKKRLEQYVKFLQQNIEEQKK